MSNYNILILSVGRRVELVECFQNAAKRLKIQSIIVGADCSDSAPAMFYTDKQVILPKITDENYIDEIINVCNREEIKLIIPTIDTDLILLSTERERIEFETDALVLISKPEIISMCRDKISTQKYLEENGFKIPKMYTREELKSEDLTFPLFIKPKSGSSSINIFKVNNLEELHIYQSIIKEPIIQDYMEGDEYTVDAFSDFQGKVITIVPRLRMATRGGEISKGKIVKDREIIKDVKKLIESIKPTGHVTVQLMKTSKGIEYIEINPRFGGGAPMSIKSGADSCANLYRLLMGEDLEYNENYRDNIMFFRFDNSICVDENFEVIK